MNTRDAALLWALETIRQHKGATITFRLVLTLMKRYHAAHSGDWMKDYLEVMMQESGRVSTLAVFPCWSVEFYSWRGVVRGEPGE